MVAYPQLLAKIALVAEQAGRNPTEITLVAVSKGHAWEVVASAYLEGCRQYGENRLVEALPKMAQAPKDIDWHLIGTLQSNKVTKAVGQFALIHSVDSPELAHKISRVSIEKGLVSKILLQVNTSGELSKHGCSPDEWEKHLDEVIAFPGIAIEGLMTMAPLTASESEIRQCFFSLRTLRDSWQNRYTSHSFYNLSMGMSNDWELAIAEGATILRIGSLLFNKP